jgi:arginase
VIEAPYPRPSGVQTLPDALLRAGLIDHLQARHAGRVVPESPYDSRRDSTALTLNAAAIASFSQNLADAVGEVIDRGEFPVVLGGDYSILLGDLLALKQRGRYGLLFVDGHADFYHPEANPTGEAASMDLALATGRGPDILTNTEGRKPLINDEDVVGFGFRRRAGRVRKSATPSGTRDLRFGYGSQSRPRRGSTRCRQAPDA